jgi:CRP-like cAMP-binding protein
MVGPCWSLKGTELLAGVDDAERQKIERKCRCFSYNKGTDVIKRGDKSKEVIFVVSGCVHVFIYSESDKLIALENIAAGGFCGELAAIDDQGRSASVCVVEDNTKIALLSQQDFWNLLEANHEIAARVMLRLANLVRKSTEQVIGTNFRDWWRQLVPKLIDRSALIVGVFYLYVSLVGVLFSYVFYRKFGVNVFSYFDISDFLLSGLKEPLILLIPVGAFLFAALLLAGNYTWRRFWTAKIDRWIKTFDRPNQSTEFFPRIWLPLLKFQKRRLDSPLIQRAETFMNYVGAVTFCIMSLAYIYEFSTYRARVILEGDVRAENDISIILKKNGNSPSSNFDNVSKIGSTQKFLFVYAHEAGEGQATTDRSGTVHILPISEIAQISTRLHRGSKEKTAPRDSKANTK